ncbi:uncharacterized protein LOC110448950 [Mizuhopecten yessoensis]|uniref:uncharacterized protein LOC110448950 n=1 Tax=Mizuhopecten yessoensis TaxID=6573 RepID=UPI000B457650|nr:uncharacterized protein LOC110448950 [Mizuhopecten yessoensis]
MDDELLSLDGYTSRSALSRESSRYDGVTLLGFDPDLQGGCRVSRPEVGVPTPVKYVFYVPFFHVSIVLLCDDVVTSIQECTYDSKLLGFIGCRKTTAVPYLKVSFAVKSKNYVLVRTFLKTSLKQARKNQTVIMLFILLVILSIAGYGAPATTTSPPGTTLSPAVEKFKALVNTEVTALWNGVHHDTDGNLDQGDLDALFKGYDDDGNQQISQSEFLAHFSHNQQNLVVIAQGLFYELDMDNDNEITKSDMQRYYEKIDKNDDGSVDQAEFESYFKDTLTLLFVLQFESQMSTTPAST